MAVANFDGAKSGVLKAPTTQFGSPVQYSDILGIVFLNANTEATKDIDRPRIAVGDLFGQAADHFVDVEGGVHLPILVLIEDEEITRTALPNQIRNENLE